MFTGIIEEIGIVKKITSDKMTIEAEKVMGDLKAGDSIAVNGACLTVTGLADNTFSVEVMPETMKRTSFNLLHTGDVVNLERALSASGRFGGHFVQGHIDGVGRISALIRSGNAIIMKVAVTPEISRYLVEKGFIAVDGVSLTVVDYNTSEFSVSLVTFTRENTALGKKRVGQLVNLEVDILAKYVEKYSKKSSDVMMANFLEDCDYLSSGRS